MKVPIRGVFDGALGLLLILLGLLSPGKTWLTNSIALITVGGLLVSFSLVSLAKAIWSRSKG